MKNNNVKIDDIMKESMKDPEFARISHVEDIKLDLAEAMVNSRKDKKYL
ncbi:hypothetical protein LPAF129_09500 [Ligilactobacillus pabuli]|uniref:Uncharacterized protein n=1 Tax=Ligilactobacillus pabuli TaxID=2886039 RepID=A0ABQ5JGR4_9LACO|nr:hypothetical protein [Ligilactobacillus pabuli]GKS81264.1 hypothetical protein LPAF129_09500 [Ligilactobacillus pabuli]